MTDDDRHRGVTDERLDRVLTAYFDGTLDREEAVGRLGRSTVERAEREREAVEADVRWGLHV
jgi:hypothetical protein